MAVDEITEIPAREFTFELNTGSVSVPVWVEVEGIDTLGHSPTTNRADTRHFTDGGRHKHWVASRGDSFTMAGKRQENPATGARAPGQEACETWAGLVGPDSLKQFRITSPAEAGAEVLTFLASVEATKFGGGNDDPSAWSIAIEVTGPITGGSTDDLPDAPTAVAGSNGNTFTLVTWTGPTEGSPYLLYEVTAYDMDDSGALHATVTSSSEPIHVPGLVNGTDYTVRVRALNAVGWGPMSAASSTITPSA
jgi:hypothetical protein